MSIETSEATALRLAIGFGVEASKKKALEVAKRSDPAWRSEIESFINEFHLSTGLVFSTPSQKLCSCHLADPWTAHKIVKNAAHRHLPELAACAGAIYHIAQWEQKIASYKDWHEITATTVLRALGSNIPSAYKAMRDVGPVLNKTTKDGLPIPDKRYATHILKGINILHTSQKIKGFNLNLTDTPGFFKSEILDDEDVITAAMASFLDELAPADFGFSLEEPEQSGKMKAWQFARVSRIKRFYPPWLGHTNCGRSFFWADMLMPSFGYRAYSLKNPGIEFKNPLEFSIPKFFSEIDFAGSVVNKSPQAWIRNEIHLAKIDFKQKDVFTIIGPETARFNFRLIDMHFESSYIRKNNDGTKNQVLYLNDFKTPSGARAAIASYRYKEIETAYPVFKRVKYIHAIFRLFVFLREDGWELDNSLRKKLDTKLKALKTKPKADDIVLSVPNH